MNPIQVVITLLVFWGPSAFADTIYNCKEDTLSQISFDIEGPRLRSSSITPKDPKSVTLVVAGKKASVKNAAGEQNELKKLSENVYYDDSHSNKVFWSVYPGSGTIPTYIFYQSSLKAVGPMALSYAYICK